MLGAMMESLVVILAYLAALALILFPPRGLGFEDEVPAPWWRNVRVWASFVIVAQIAVYAFWG